MQTAFSLPFQVYFIAPFVAIAGLMFQLHNAVKRELNEDEALQQSIDATLDRERVAAFRAFIDASTLISDVGDLLGLPMDDDDRWNLADIYEASLYDYSVKIYFPLARCVKLRVARARHLTFLRAGKLVTFVAVLLGLLGALAAAATLTGWPPLRGASVSILGADGVAAMASLVLWFLADGKHSVIADIRRRRHAKGEA